MTSASDMFDPKQASRRFSRREVIGAGCAVVAGTALATGIRAWQRHEGGMRSSVFIGKADTYGADLVGVIRNGFLELGITPQVIRGKRILLKPNLVETATGHQHINTHPSVVLAAAEVFRSLDAGAVVVGEGQGHRRDSRLVLHESGMGSALKTGQLNFIDLNHDDIMVTANAGGWGALKKLYFPRSLETFDFIVSMPKLKTHHWTGVTCSMKNFFGVMPGIVYGWPKNVLHHAGIDNCILDINATVRPFLSIVDAIVGMEGDGPIMGSAKQLGCLVMGRNLPAVDATCTRLMGLNPYGVKYLTGASGRLGPIVDANIDQHGEPIRRMRSRFRVLDLPHLSAIASA